MKFERALSALRAGQRIGLAGEPYEYLRIEDHVIYLCGDDADLIWAPTSEQLLSNEWEIKVTYSTAESLYPGLYARCCYLWSNFQIRYDWDTDEHGSGIIYAGWHATHEKAKYGVVGWEVCEDTHSEVIRELLVEAIEDANSSTYVPHGIAKGE